MHSLHVLSHISSASELHETYPTGGFPSHVPRLVVAGVAFYVQRICRNLFNNPIDKLTIGIRTAFLFTIDDTNKQVDSECKNIIIPTLKRSTKINSEFQTIYACYKHALCDLLKFDYC